VSKRWPLELPPGVVCGCCCRPLLCMQGRDLWRQMVSHVLHLYRIEKQSHHLLQPCYKPQMHVHHLTVETLERSPDSGASRTFWSSNSIGKMSSSSTSSFSSMKVPIGIAFSG
jgi:hypothetical protein